MAGLDPAIRVFLRERAESWVPGPNPGMTGAPDFRHPAVRTLRDCWGQMPLTLRKAAGQRDHGFVLTGIGAGLVSALLTAVVTKATPLAAILYLLSPIPVLIVSSAGHRAGLIATAVGGAVIAAFLSPLSGLGFAVVTALPAWWLSYLALLGRPNQDGTMEWYPVGRLLVWMAATAALTIVAAESLTTGGDHAEFHQNAREVSQALVNLQFPQGGKDPWTQSCAKASSSGSRS